jgi:hypothetical protein
MIDSIIDLSCTGLCGHYISGSKGFYHNNFYSASNQRTRFRVKREATPFQTDRNIFSKTMNLW